VEILLERALERDLKEWKESSLRYPLLIRGARQVGKTYLVEQFAKREFESFASVNFESQPEAAGCFETLDPTEILIRLEKILRLPIRPGKTLLFLDEIQACPQAIVALRYFKERMPALHVIGAGSLLEFALTSGKFSFPVGRVQFMYLKPLSLQEFAKAMGKSHLLQQFSSQLHGEAIRLVKEYFLIGGMPAVISAYRQNHSLLDCAKIQDILLATYRADFAKYASPVEQKYLKVLFDGIPQTIGQHFKYSKIDPDIRSRELKTALQQLEGAGLIQEIHATSAAGIPLSAQLKQARFKLLFLDIGLAQRSLRIDPEVILDKDLVQINAGAIAEQFVGQELIAYADPHRDERLFYWEREKQQSSAEVDYILTIDGKIVPVEVKAGSYGKLKSLHQFMQEKKSSLGVKISQDVLSFENRVLFVPIYLIGQLPDLVRGHAG